MGYFDAFVQFLLDEKRRLSSKAAVSVLIVVGILVVDNILGFSYYHSNNNKIDQLQKLNSILQDTKVDSTTKVFATNLRSEVIGRNNIFTRAFNFLWGKSSTSLNEDARTKEVADKNEFWFNLSAGGVYFLLAFITIPVFLITGEKAAFIRRLATGITSAVSLFLLGLFMIWIGQLIPQISSNTWIWNYIINFFIQVFIISFLWYFALQQVKHPQ